MTLIRTAAITFAAACLIAGPAAAGTKEGGKNKRLRADKFKTVEKLVAEVRGKNLLDLPELETAAATGIVVATVRTHRMPASEFSHTYSPRAG